MYIARFIVLLIALGAGAAAAYLASGSVPETRPSAAVAPAAQLQTVDVLVAKADIGLGQSVKPEELQWQSWPASTASGSFIRRSDRPDASPQIVGWIARAPFITSPPIRQHKLVKA